MKKSNNRMLGMSTRGRLFLSTLLAISVMDQVVLATVAKSGRSLRMSGWEKRSNIWCSIGGCFDAVTDSAAAGCNPGSKSVCCCGC